MYTMYRSSATWIFILMSFIVGISSCEIPEEPGLLTTEVRELDSFEGIIVETIGKIRLFESNENKIIINTNENVLDDLRTYVSGGNLIIQLTGRHRKIQKLEVDVYTSSYRYIKQNSVADIESMTGINTERLDIIQAGVGQIELPDIITENLLITLDDVGNVTIGGSTRTLFCDLDGVGDIKLFDLAAKTGELILSGVGDIEVNVSDTLKIDLSGTGSVFYKGSPDMSINLTGIGKILQVK